MKIGIGCDHAGVKFKEQIKDYVKSLGYEVEDFGAYTTDRVDYPDIAKTVCESVTSGACEKGILICGTGIGMSMAANKMRGIRAALCSDTYSAHITREHNDANVLAMGARVIGIDLGCDIVKSFLTAEYVGGRHAVRVEKMMAFEEL
ncbi:MAG: ribose 5-phosphate isomerase B [Ruminococcaceae bacterium]|nr:ribose 5-phosphate isomerase B [Oscillospiraceae bacterium]